MEKRYRKAVFIVVYCRSRRSGIARYILLKRKLHWSGWEFPKGGIERGEKQINAVRREIKEETSLAVRKIARYNIVGRYIYNSAARKDRPGFIGQSFRLYSAEVCLGKVIIDKKEHLGYKWLEFEEAYRKLKWKNQKKCLSFANAKILKEN